MHCVILILLSDSKIEDEIKSIWFERCSNRLDTNNANQKLNSVNDPSWLLLLLNQFVKVCAVANWKLIVSLGQSMVRSHLSFVETKHKSLSKIECWRRWQSAHGFNRVQALIRPFSILWEINTRIGAEWKVFSGENR